MLAILSPHQNAYTETFIQAHKKLNNGNVKYYYGRGVRGLKLEGGDLNPGKVDWFLNKAKVTE